MELQQVLSGIMAYIDKTIVPGMNDVQEFGYYALCEMLKDDPTPLRKLLEQNIFARVLLSCDKDGNVDIDRAAAAARKAIQRKGKFSFKVPGYGSFTLTEQDVEDIISTVRR